MNQRLRRTVTGSQKIVLSRFLFGVGWKGRHRLKRSAIVLRSFGIDSALIAARRFGRRRTSVRSGSLVD
jgi:hypothetical protein